MTPASAFPLEITAAPRYRVALTRERTRVCRFGESSGAHFAEANPYRIGAAGECAELVRRGNGYAQMLPALRLLSASVERLLHATSREAVRDLRAAQDIARAVLVDVEPPKHSPAERGIRP